MGAVFCFLLFLAAVGLCILLGQSLILAIWVGIAAFAALGLRRGMTVRAMWDAAWEQGRKMCCVIVIYMLIGAITALWRSAGTIAFFIYHGLRIITPQLFLLVTFLLTSFISYALGTSFGVVGTLGVILMALARSGGVSVAITAGTIVAGAYFGDRCSPASSSATLVAAATDTKLYDNLHMMHRTGWLPYLVSLAAYAALSVTHPLAMVDSGVLDQLSGTFSLSWWTAIPALLILILPLCKVPIRPTMAVSALTALLVTVFAQGRALLPTLRDAVLGYLPAPGALHDVLSGGGMMSMVSATIMAVSAGLYAGLLGGTGLTMMAAGLFLLAFLPEHPTDFDIIWRLVLCGAGFGLFQSPNNSILIASAPPERSGSPPARRSPWCAAWCSATSPPARWCATSCWGTTTPSAATAGARWPLTSRTPASSSRR